MAATARGEPCKGVSAIAAVDELCFHIRTRAAHDDCSAAAHASVAQRVARDHPHAPREATRLAHDDLALEQLDVRVACRREAGKHTELEWASWEQRCLMT